MKDSFSLSQFSSGAKRTRVNVSSDIKKGTLRKRRVGRQVGDGALKHAATEYRQRASPIGVGKECGVNVRAGINPVTGNCRTLHGYRCRNGSVTADRFRKNIRARLSKLGQSHVVGVHTLTWLSGATLNKYWSTGRRKEKGSTIPLPLIPSC